MWSPNELFFRGLFPFVPDNVPNVFAAGSFARSATPEEYWLFPDEETSAFIGTPVGPMTGFPIVLTKEQLAWFIYKAKTWSVTASASFSLTITRTDFLTDELREIDTFEGEADFSFEMGRNISKSGEEVTENTNPTIVPYRQYLPNEKSLIRGLNVGSIDTGINVFGGSVPFLPERSETVQYTQTATRIRYNPEAETTVTQTEENANISLFLIAESFQEPLKYPLYAWTPSEDSVAEYGSWMKKDSLIACSFMATIGLGGFLTARTNSLQDPGQFAFPENYEAIANVVIEVPWDEAGISFPLFSEMLPEPSEVGGLINTFEGQKQLSDIVLTPTSFWEYEPPL